MAFRLFVFFAACILLFNLAKVAGLKFNNEEFQRRLGVIGVNNLTGLNILHKDFNSKQECVEFARNNAGNIDKLQLGVMACNYIFSEANNELNNPFGKCIINKYAEILDKNSLIKIITICSESTHNINGGLALSNYFSDSRKIQDALEEDQRMREVTERRRTAMGIMDGIQNRRSTTCVWIGEILQCD
jgi:hypothetical protein